MLFNSYAFIFLFLPLSLAAFYAARRIGNGHAALAVTILSSLAFYAYWRAAYVPVLICSILINYAVGTAIVRGVARFPLISIGVCANLSFLAYFKYSDFLIGQLNMLGTDLPLPHVALPLAISFYTFQQIAYLVDCYRGKLKEPGFAEYVFTVTFFPHLIAGPIVRMREILPQFEAFAKKPFLQNVALGLVIFIIGLGKKVLIADHFGQLSDPFFASVASGHVAASLDAWGATLSYTLQIYFDFSGYSDMAIGLSRMFGFRLAVNFLSPYQAVSIADFWRRWHVTLSRFLRDYLYVPLGGSRRGRVQTYVNLLATMALGGLWHGASWTFVAWGLYHGFLLALHRLWRDFGSGSIPNAISAAMTFLAVVIGWVLFRSHDFHSAGAMLAAMFTPIHTPSIMPTQAWLAIVAALIFTWVSPNIYQIFCQFRPALILRNQFPMLHPISLNYSFGFTVIEAIFVSVVLMACLVGMRGVVSTFLYFMF